MVSILPDTAKYLAQKRGTISIRRLLLLTLLSGFVRPLSAQITLNAGAGLAVPTGNDLTGQAQLGYSVSLGGGVNWGRHLATTLEFNSNSVNVDVGRSLGFYSLTLWSLTAAPRVKFDISKGLQLYVTGGYGLYARQDPVNTGTTYKGGVNGGGGLGLKISEATTLYLEMRLHRMFNGGRNTTYAPIILGVRWN